MLVGDPAATIELCSVRLFRRVAGKGSPRNRGTNEESSQLFTCRTLGSSIGVE